MRKFAIFLSELLSALVSIAGIAIVGAVAYYLWIHLPAVVVWLNAH